MDGGGTRTHIHMSACTKIDFISLFCLLIFLHCTGDTPIIGAGTYANDNTCAVSATGKGEEFMRHVAAYDVSARIEIGMM